MRERLQIRPDVLIREIIDGSLPHDFPQVLAGELQTEGWAKGRYRVAWLRERGTRPFVTWFKKSEVKVLRRFTPK